MRARFPVICFFFNKMVLVLTLAARSHAAPLTTAFASLFRDPVSLSSLRAPAVQPRRAIAVREFSSLAPKLEPGQTSRERQEVADPRYLRTSADGDEQTTRVIMWRAEVRGLVISKVERCNRNGEGFGHGTRAARRSPCERGKGAAAQGRAAPRAAQIDAACAD